MIKLDKPLTIRVSAEIVKIIKDNGRWGEPASQVLERLLGIKKEKR